MKHLLWILPVLWSACGYSELEMQAMRDRVELLQKALEAEHAACRPRS